MTIKSYILDNKSSLSLVTLGLAISIMTGLCILMFPEEIHFVSVSSICIWITILIITSIKYSFYDFIFCNSFLIFEFPFFHNVTSVMRFILLFLLGGVSAYLTRKEKVSKNPVALGLGLVALYSIGTSFWSFYPTISLLKGISILLMAVFLFFGPSALQLLHPGIGAKGFVIKVFFYFSIIIVISNALFFIIMPGSSFSDGRFYGWMGNPNNVGAIYGIFILPVLGYEFKRDRFGFARLAFMLTFLLAAIQLFASRSRAGLLAGLFSLLVLSFGQKKQVKKLSYLTIIGMLGFISLLVSLSNWENSLLRNLIYRNEVTLQGSGRLPAMAEVWNNFKSHLILGSGLGVADTGAKRKALVTSSSGFQTEKSNSYLAALEELGIVGCLILIMTLLLPICKACLRELSAHTFETDRLNLTLAAILIAGLVNTNFEAWLLSVGSFEGFYFWIVASLLFFEEKKEVPKKGEGLYTVGKTQLAGV